MDTTPVRCLMNSISRFILLVSCQTRKCMPILEDYQSMSTVVKHLKPVLDEVIDNKISSDEVLYKVCEELDMAVNEAREFMEKWCPKMSKICSIRKSEGLLTKIQSFALEICHILCSLMQSSSSTSSLAGVQHCLQVLQHMKRQTVTGHIEEALREQRDVVPCNDHLVKIIESLNLTSNQELLKESVAVEKERMNVQLNKAKTELEQIDQVVELLSHIRNCLLKVQSFEPESGVPIPPYFRCPLSLELMLDPVIVASGQTYDRVSIQRWLDQGMTVCPKTRQILSHTNLIPNYTVKAMIANWCHENNIKVSSKSECTNLSSVSCPADHNLLQVDGLRYSLLNCNSTSRSSVEAGNRFDNHSTDALSRVSGEESNGYQISENEKLKYPSHELSYVHSRSESASSAISSIEYVNHLSAEIISSECPDAAPPNNVMRFSPALSGRQFPNPETKIDAASNGKHNTSEANPLPVSQPASQELTTSSHVKKLIEDLRSQSEEVKTEAAAELRLLAKHNMENRIVIGKCGAITPLLSLLFSKEKLIQEHAVTALLNLSINEENKSMIAEAGAIEPLVHVLKSGNSGAKENSAAALFSLSGLEEYKAKIGRSGAVKALVDLLGSGTIRGKKDAATALFNLSIFHENKARIVQAGAVKCLVDLLDPASGMVDKAVALLSNLSTIGEGRLAIVRAGGIPLLVEVVESGSQRGKENAASVLMQLCLSSPKFCTLVLQEGAVPPLVALSQSGTPRAKEKAQQLLSHFRNQREMTKGRGRR
ncbi:hypothetical protein Tsubulata_016102 [Turnera subulata]|uniref:RING-type E3 ubiquitin transferase n=1 Tax=Turnera subulata TaxID=218843 RepID=A0A9Q0J190_9ROSI|nr:hypothetical protein Tsubulata_016102 [Turnera subulata]